MSQPSIFDPNLLKRQAQPGATGTGGAPPPGAMLPPGRSGLGLTGDGTAVATTGGGTITPSGGGGVPTIPGTGTGGGATGTDYAKQFGDYLATLKGGQGMGYGDMTLPGMPNMDLSSQRGQIASGAQASAKSAVGNLARNAGGNTSNPMFQYMASLTRAGSGAQAAASQVDLTNKTNQQNFQNQQSNYNLDLSRRTAANNAMDIQNRFTLGLGNLGLGQGRLGLDQTIANNKNLIDQGQLDLARLSNEQRNLIESGQLDLARLTQEQRNQLESGQLSIDQMKALAGLAPGMGDLIAKRLGYNPAGAAGQGQGQGGQPPTSLVGMTWGQGNGTNPGILGYGVNRFGMGAF